MHGVWEDEKVESPVGSPGCKCVNVIKREQSASAIRTTLAHHSLALFGWAGEILPVKSQRNST
jgi:hypothetical protein